MILISENKDYRYYTVVVEKESNGFQLNEIGIRDGTGIWVFLNYFNGEKSINNIRGIKLLNTRLSEIEILGVIGPSEISEEVAEEVMNWKNAIKHYKYASEDLKTLLKSKGILIENPMPKPKNSMAYYTDTYEFKQWQEYESKLVKAVIIRINK